MWVAVRQRFSRFVGNLDLSKEEIERGESRAAGVVGSLNRAYYGDTNSGNLAVTVGSWGKATAITPSVDVDLYYVVPQELFERFNSYHGNGQSALLNDVRNRLLVSYPQTQISGDGQVVIVGFNKLPQIEIAPCIQDRDGRFILPNSNGGGSWISADPVAEAQSLNVVDAQCSANCRPLVRIMKQWRVHCNVPIKSFHIELLVQEFLPQSSWKNHDHFYYDWLVRDFLRYLITRSNTWVYAPGTFESMNLGDNWLSRARTALSRAEKACEFEYSDWVNSAGTEWQKLFGSAVPETI